MHSTSHYITDDYFQPDSIQDSCYFPPEIPTHRAQEPVHVLRRPGTSCSKMDQRHQDSAEKCLFRIWILRFCSCNIQHQISLHPSRFIGRTNKQTHIFLIWFTWTETKALITQHSTWHPSLCSSIIISHSPQKVSMLFPSKKQSK